uniref:NADH-quinone oxidoreductase subunit A n=1 Tax=Selaginella kraussiana TaxID=81964 RepID=A0A3Q9R488_9TRAC|nr:NADH dehydrogenase subunit C [Selaginella kraussiana]AZU95784.1 NADH dehydrogenase subunit C [Selaginella kraussiana]
MLLIPEYNPSSLFPPVAGIVPLAAYLLPGAVAPASGGPEKVLGYESGMEPTGDARTRFQIRYYMFASVFVILDVETVSLYPWATSFRGPGIYASIEALTPVTILIVGLVHAWRKGALEWSQPMDTLCVTMLLGTTIPRRIRALTQQGYPWRLEPPSQLY